MKTTLEFDETTSTWTRVKGEGPPTTQSKNTRANKKEEDMLKKLINNRKERIQRIKLTSDYFQQKFEKTMYKRTLEDLDPATIADDGSGDEDDDDDDI